MNMRTHETQGRPNKGFRMLAAIVLLVLLGGCAFKVKLVGQYDEITDRAVTDLQKKTASFFSKLKTSTNSAASYEANLKFYEDAQADVSVLILRAEIIEDGLKRNPLTKNFKDLQKQLDDLAVLHKTAPPKKAIESAEKAFEQSFRAILQNLLYLKWNQVQPDAKKQ